MQILQGAYVEGWWKISILSTPSFSTFVFYCTHPRPTLLALLCSDRTSQVAGCVALSIQRLERGRRKGMRWKWLQIVGHKVMQTPGGLGAVEHLRVK